MQSGDQWSVRWIDGVCRVALVDGAGHGEAAAQAATTAIRILEEDESLDLVHLLTRCHQSLSRLRGAVMSILSIDTDGKLCVAGVGNIESRIFAEGEREQHLVTQRGMLGANLPRIRPISLELPNQWQLVLHTDGVSDRFSLADLAVEEALHSPDALASAILERHARPYDDAAVVVIHGES